MTLRLHDTATREARDFVPLVPGRAGIYVCGLTVQSEPHVGHVRSAVNFDVLRRWLLTTGYDEPGIDCIVLLRPTRSTGLYVQMVGRGFRLHPDKTNTLVLDFAGVVAMHGPVDRMNLIYQATPMTMSWCLSCHRAPRWRLPSRRRDAREYAWS